VIGDPFVVVPLGVTVTVGTDVSTTTPLLVAVTCNPTPFVANTVT